MKKSIIVAIVAIVAGIAILISMSMDMSEYGTFKKATESGEALKVVGTLVKNRPIEYNPEINPNYFSFYMEDEDGEVRKVKMNEARPTDFDKSEKIVITGRMEDNTFVGSDMLLKCPSKYKDEELTLKQKK